MECDKVQIAKVVGEYVHLPCGKKIRLYRVLHNGALQINPLFEQIRSYLWWTESFLDTNGAPNTSSQPFYTLPSRSLTTLVSVDREPNGACLWTIVSDVNGPVSNADGAVLNIPNSFLEYRFRWILTEPTTIAFYSEIVDGSVVPMLDTCGNITVYDGCSLSGEFITYDYSEVVIITSKTVGVTLYVDLLVPDEPYTYVVPSTVYLEFEYRCEQYKFPVYDLRYGPELVDVIVHKNLLKLETLVKSSIMDLAVPIPPVVSILQTSVQTPIITLEPPPSITALGFSSIFLATYPLDQLDTSTRLDTQSNLNTSISVYPSNRYFDRTVSYEIELADGITEIGSTYTIELYFAPLAKFMYRQEKNGTPIFNTYTYNGPITIAGTLVLETHLTSAIIMINFESYEGAGNGIQFKSLKYWAYTFN